MYKTTKLNRQIHLYSLDTGCFYTEKEQQLHNAMLRYLRYRTQLKSASQEQWAEEQHTKCKKLNTIINQRTKAYKQKLLEEIKTGTGLTRILPEEKLTDTRIISVFESSLTRISHMETNEITKDIMVVQTFFYDIIHQLLTNGYYYQGEKYIYFTSSAGQIRTKKTVFIKESLWERIQHALMCGLTIERINQKGGININKFLAYLALSNSATDEWKDFDIRTCIVVPDFETKVGGEIDYIDDISYQTKRKIMDVPITHTDGCGMILPKLSKKNFMIRLPWMKGLLASFDFVKFIKETDASPVVRDIYGQEWDILKDNIQIIFTESQFKMHMYYSSWSQYQYFFEMHNCQAGICNMEADYFSNATINYQMLQTLTDVTSEELDLLISPSQNTLKRISTDKKTILRIFGVTKSNQDKTNLQQALELYPEILNDEYCRARLREIKKSLVKEFRSGKLEINGKYTFIVPDLHAFCQHLFLHIPVPEGLLQNGEVCCRLFQQHEKLDCLRSPHLYKEHAVRKNNLDTSQLLWFKTNALYTSSHDLISRILQFDVDGDRSLVVADKTLVEIASRNITKDNIVPLYYEMKKAKPTLLTPDSLYEGLNAAYSGGNIGYYSNSICKIFNSIDWENIGKEEKKEALNVIKLLCMENNFCIDMAKTLYMPERPAHIDALINQYVKGKLPHFFQYAKEKTNEQTEAAGNSLVDRIAEKISYSPIRMSVKNFGKFNYRKLMSNPRISIDYENVIERYNTLNRKYHFRITPGNRDNIDYLMQNIREDLLTLGYSESDLCDMLVKHLYTKKTPHKELLWQCFGQSIVNNLRKNIPAGSIQCEACGERFLPSSNNQKYCKNCSGYRPMGTKVIQCIDCGVNVEIDAKDTETCRCQRHRDEHKKLLRREQNKRAYERRKNFQYSSILNS